MGRTPIAKNDDFDPKLIFFIIAGMQLHLLYVDILRIIIYDQLATNRKYSKKLYIIETLDEWWVRE